jgi:wobble nucleotide-excising tRNase
MIHKINQLISIGKFRNYQASGDVVFKKLTLIYADNGSGKSTLTAVFRSLGESDVDIIKRRLSTGATLAQAAQIVQRVIGVDTFHTYRPTAWTNPFPDLEIFDTHFVNANIYSGFDFTDDHKKQLYQFVIGAQGVAIQQQIEQNKRDKTASRLRVEAFELQLFQQVGNGLTAGMITPFLALTTLPAGIGQQITAAQASLSSANATSVIQTLQSLVSLATINPGLDFNAIITDLRATTQTIQDAALHKIFADHCSDLERNSIESPENWLRIGFDYVKAKSGEPADETPHSVHCPFCQQPIANSLDIINAYTQQFNDEFNSLVQRIQGYERLISSFNLETVIQALNHSIQSNIASVTSWGTHLPTTVPSPSTTIINNEAAFRGELQSLLAVLRQKLQNPSTAVNFASVTAFQSSVQTVNLNITTYNGEVGIYNAAIALFKNGIQTVAQAQDEVNKLKRIQKRFDTGIAAICTQLQAEKLNLRQLENAYSPLVQQQETAATAFFVRYKDRINHYLDRVFKTPFKIDNVGHVSPQGRAMYSRIGYQLTINGQPISFDHTQNHNAKDCLSEGDKSTLALAFFLAKLDIDPGKANKILIFDDPLSSFDRNRRLYTVQLLNDLLTQVKQMVVLSHNESFLYDLSKTVAAGDKKTLRIREDFTTKASSVEPLSLESMVENDYFKHVAELELFLTHADIVKKDYVLGLMRNILEAHIRFKFYRQTVALPPHNQTLGTLITTIDTAGVVFRDNPHRADVLSKLRLINGISCKPHHGEPMPNYSTLGVDPNTITVTELAGFVQDTLDLIDTRL